MMGVRFRNKRRTLMSVLAALGLATTLFMYFQFFSMGMMDYHEQQRQNVPESNNDAFILPVNDDRQPIKDRSSKISDIDCDKSGNCDNDNKQVNDIPDEDDVVDMIRMKELNNLLEGNLAAIMSVDYPRGVKKELAARYKPDEKNMFSCLHSEEQVAFWMVNDDYCDCADGTDEPGTAACSDSRFYCTFQVSGIFSLDIPSSRVNDGICDCCDGSDEWKNFTLPGHVYLADSKPHYGVHQSPCINRCHEQIQNAREILHIHQQGAVLKQSYIKEAFGQKNPQQVYGIKGEFYKLSQNCYTKKSDKYEYTVCPFKEAKQQVFPEASTVIGRDPIWVSRGNTEGKWELKLEHGDSKQCPGLIKRESTIYFECGIADVVLSVQETEVCQYSIKFSTPAAC